MPGPVAWERALQLQARQTGEMERECGGTARGKPGSGTELDKVLTSKMKTVAGLKGAQNCFFRKIPTEAGRLIRKVCAFVQKINYLELIVQVETQRQPYKDSLSFSDSEIAERKTYRELAAENKNELQGTRNCPSLFPTSRKPSTRVI